MKFNKVKANSKGFTLIELLIVVVILGILAAVIVPQLSGTTDNAKVESLKANLSNVRSAIDMYYQEHGHYSGSVTAVPVGNCAPGTPGSGNASTAADKAIAFAEQLTMYTNSNGGACSVKDPDVDGTDDFPFGPYLKSSSPGPNGLPYNPITNSNTVTVVSNGDLNLTSSSNIGGWKYDEVAGKFIADHSSYDQY